VDTAPPVRVILDTNIYIIGYQFPACDEHRVLEIVRLTPAQFLATYEQESDR
jgi:hypothetical protein